MEGLAQQLGDEVEIDIEIAVHEHVPEAGDSTEALAELCRQHVRFHEAVDGRAVGRRVEAGRGRDVACDVECVLRTELEAAFDDPPKVGVRTELLRRDAGVPTQGSQRLAQGYEMPVHDLPVDVARGHRQPLPAAKRRAASIFAICGRKSKYRESARPARVVVARRSRESNRTPSRSTRW